MFSAKYWTGHQYFIHKLDLYCALASKKKSIPDWHLFITGMEMKWTKRYAMKSHVIAYQSLELLFGTHTFHFNCFFEDFNCVFTQIRCLSRGLINISRVTYTENLVSTITLQLICLIYMECLNTINNNRR